MRLACFLIILSLSLFTGPVYPIAVPYPVIFVHGTGDSSVAWKTTGSDISRYLDKYYKTSSHPYFSSGSGIGADRFEKDFLDNTRNSCVYLVFSDHFASPDKLVNELKKVIDDTREEAWSNFKDYFATKEDVKVNLVCHSMGGLVARKYLVDNMKDHHVSKLILMGTPNKGISGLKLEWVPVGLMAGGGAAFLLSSNPLFLVVSAVGIGGYAVSYARGVQLLSPANSAMKPDSTFLKDLNSRSMPFDVDYVVILCSADDFMHEAANVILGYKDGDGAISIDSQSLRYCSIPDFKEVHYKELYIKSPHFEEPARGTIAVIEALGL